MLGNKGLGSVLGVVLFVLLSVAAISIIWSVVIYNLNKSSENSASAIDCLALDVSVHSCVLNLTEFADTTGNKWNIMSLNFNIDRGTRAGVKYLDLNFKGIRVDPINVIVGLFELNNTYEISQLEKKRFTERVNVVIPGNPSSWYFSSLFNNFWTQSPYTYFFPIEITPRVYIEDSSCPLPPIKCTCIDEEVPPVGNSFPACDYLNVFENALGI